MPDSIIKQFPLNQKGFYPCDWKNHLDWLVYEQIKPLTHYAFVAYNKGDPLTNASPYLANKEIAVHKSDPAERKEAKHDIHDVVDVVSQRPFVDMWHETHQDRNISSWLMINHHNWLVTNAFTNVITNLNHCSNKNNFTLISIPQCCQISALSTLKINQKSRLKKLMPLKK